MGILVIFCCYFLSDQPDSLSVMHFDPNPACPSVITKAIKSTPKDGFSQTSVTYSTNNNGNSHKTNIPKHISYETILPDVGGYFYYPLTLAIPAFSLPENYNYLFYEEVNPPPPKFC